MFFVNRGGGAGMQKDAAHVEKCLGRAAKAGPDGKDWKWIL